MTSVTLAERAWRRARSREPARRGGPARSDPRSRVRSGPGRRPYGFTCRPHGGGGAIRFSPAAGRPAWARRAARACSCRYRPSRIPASGDLDAAHFHPVSVAACRGPGRRQDFRGARARPGPRRSGRAAPSPGPVHRKRAGARVEAGAASAGRRRRGPSRRPRRKASAACCAVVMVVLPCACRVAAVVKMMKYATRFEKNMPVTISVRDRRSSSLVAPCRLRSASPTCSAKSSS